jgi:hypothetical protein
MAKKKEQKKEIDLVLNNLYLRYFFNRDMGDLARANYWMQRIDEHKKTTNDTHP